MSALMLPYFLALTLACLVSLCLTPLVRSGARWACVLDVPDGKRKRHAQPVPKLGGIAIFVSFYSCAWLTLGLVDWAHAHEASQLISALFLPSLVILALGVADDLSPTGPWVKIGVQLVAGVLIFYRLDLGVTGIAGTGAGSTLSFLGLPVTLLWVVLVTNAFNIVDGIDGLAAGVGFIAAVSLVLVSLATGNLALAFVAIPLAGAVLGFLRYNFNPASVFLGDSGSLLLGFKFAALSLVASTSSSTPLVPLASLLILALPLTEAATSVIRRFLAGRSILQPDIHHIHHQLMRQGLEPRRAATVLYGWAAAFGLAALVVVYSGPAGVVIVGLSCVAITGIGIQRLGYVEFAEIMGLLDRCRQQRRIIQDNIISRRLADDLRRATSVADAWSLLQAAAQALGFSHIELRRRTHRDEGADRQGMVRYAQQLCSVSRAAGAETKFAVALNGANDVLGEVVFRRSTAAPPFHSFAVLVGDVSSGLSHVLENCATAPAVVAARENNEYEIDAERRAPQRQVVACGSCGSFDLHRTRTSSFAERLRKSITNKRPHACGACGWRAWMLPFIDEPAHAAGTPGAQPDFQALDRAV